MSKKLGLIFVWFLSTPILLLASVLIFKAQSAAVAKPVSSVVASETITSNEVDGEVLGVKISDLRPYKVSRFLRGRELEPYSQYMVDVADKYGLDYRLIPALAMKESGGGDEILAGSYNAWGFENGYTQFLSWEQAIDNVGRTLKERYISKGLITPEQIMPIYAPPAVEAGGGWARDINTFFSQIESY